MAIGFALSSVIGIELDDKDDSLYFDLRTIRYQIMLDDHAKVKELADALNKHLSKVPEPAKKKKPLPDFYVNTQGGNNI
jgi:hypothetical protein